MKVFFFFFFGTIAIGILENILYAMWARWYFELGPRIFRLSVPINATVRLPISAENLQSLIPDSSYTKLLVKELADGKYAIREKGFEFSKMGYTPLMRGLLIVDQFSRTAKMEGLLNFYPIVFSFLVLAFALTFNIAALIFLAFLAGLEYWIYSIQSKRFTDVLRALNSQPS